MATTYSWDITKLDYYDDLDGLKNVVKTVHYTCTGQNDKDMQWTMWGQVRVDTNVDPNTFINYNNLNQSIVLGWVQTTLGDVGIQNIENIINDHLVDQQNASTITQHNQNPPWV
jgi:hypothetical protein